MNIEDPRSPVNYKPHPMGYCCVDCNASARIGQAVYHSSRCDIAPREYVLPYNQVEGESSKRSQRRGTSANALAKRDAKARKRVSIVVAAKRGDARLHFTDDEIEQAVRDGKISRSDAMNQDF